MMKDPMRASMIWNCLCALCVLVVSSSVRAEKIEYNRDVRPILAENCFACHGPDSASRKADLRLDRRDEAVKAEAIVPGNPDKSDSGRAHLLGRQGAGDAAAARRTRS